MMSGLFEELLGLNVILSLMNVGTVIQKRLYSSTAHPKLKTKKIIINSLNEEITIPWEVLQVSGAFKIGFYATSETEVLPTLWSNLIEIESGTTTNGTAPTEYTPSEIEQLKMQKQDKLIPGANIIIENNGGDG